VKLNNLLQLIGIFKIIDYDEHVKGVVNKELGLKNNVIIQEIYNLQNYLLKINKAGTGDLVHGLLVIQRMVCGCEIYPAAKIGKNLEIVHGGGIVVSGSATIGDNCQLYSGVVIGDKNGNGQSPTIGNYVRVFANSVLFGGITVGDNIVISANSIVSKDVPSNSIVYGVNNVQVRK
jgi:serine O-acetyltransferase